MTGPTIGSLFTGYGGLDLAVEQVLGGRTVWVSDVCKVNKDGSAGHRTPHRSPCTILAHRFPHAPNLGDITKVDWSAVTRPDVLTLGFPCQDVSIGGNRLGIRPGTRSGLWSQAAYAISVLKPRLVVIENVRGLYSARAHSDVEPCPWCVGETADGALRALGAVLGDLADLGFDAEWVGVPASRVGACHGRLRVFVAAYPRGEPFRFDARDTPCPEAGPLEGDVAEHRARAHAPADVTLLPTPAVNDMGTAYTPDTWDEWTARMQAAHDNGNGHGKSLAIEAQRVEASGQWGEYAQAVARWEALTRPAPAPTVVDDQGRRRTAGDFTEWMMGLPDGWITQVPGMTRQEANKAAGNGVVPQQAVYALRVLLARARTEKTVDS